MDSVVGVLKSLELSDEEIADRSQMRLERVREIIQGSHIKQSELRALARGLNISLKAFAAGAARREIADDLGILFRESKFLKTTGHVATLETVSAFVEGALRILPVRQEKEKWLDKFSPSSETYREAGRLAAQFRHLFASEDPLGPLTDLPSVLSEKANVIISRLENSRYEGASVIAGGYCFIFVSLRFPGRMLFTVAHELGHLIAHHTAGSMATFDKPTQIGGKKGTDKTEFFANALASNLLLPDQGLAIALKSIRKMGHVVKDEVGDIEILTLARMYGVSFEVAARRCEDLELLPRGGAKALYAYLKQKHGSPEKRADHLGLPPRNLAQVPRVSNNLKHYLIKAIDSGHVSIGWAVDAFQLSIKEIYGWRVGAENFEFRH